MFEGYNKSRDKIKKTEEIFRRKKMSKKNAETYYVVGEAIATANYNAANTYTVKGLKAGKTYKFAVKAYRNDNGTIVWSDVFTSVTTKTVAK